MRKWQMGDLETQMKFSLLDCTWLEKIAYGLVFKALSDFNEAKKELRSIFIFSLFLFFLFFIFYSSFFMLLRTFNQHSTCYSSPPPCLNDCSSSSIEVMGPMAAREVQNPCIPL
jgi:hypothetical protein